MRYVNWLFALPTVCLGAVILTSFVIFYAFRRGSRVIDQLRENNAEGTPDPDAVLAADTRWAHGDLADNDAPENTIEMTACPACGGENMAGAGVCAYCGRKV